MCRFLLLFILLFPFSIYAENISLDNSIYEVMRIGFILPPADLRWENTSTKSNYTDIKAKIRKQLQDALELNKKYPNITIILTLLSCRFYQERCLRADCVENSVPQEVDN